MMRVVAVVEYWGGPKCGQRREFAHSPTSGTREILYGGHYSFTYVGGSPIRLLFVWTQEPPDSSVDTG